MTEKRNFKNLLSFLLFVVISFLPFDFLQAENNFSEEGSSKAELEEEVQTLRMELEELKEQFLQFQDAVRRGLNPPEERLTISGFDVQGTTLPKDALDAVLKPLTERRHALEDLQSEVKRLILESYSALGIRGVQVAIPPQEISEEPLIVQVVEPILGYIEIDGNRWFGDKNIRRFFEGRITTLDGVLVANDLEVALDKVNRHPDRQITAILRPGDEPGSTNVNLNVKERQPFHRLSPFHYTVEINNTGTSNVGRIRYLNTFQYSNLFDRDHVVTANWQFAPDNFSNLQIFGGSYLAPIGTTGHTFSIFGGYSDVATNALIDTLEILGEGYSIGTQLSFQLPAFRRLETRLNLGMEISQLKNSLDFGTNTTIESKVGRLPVSLRWSFQRRDTWGTTLGFIGFKYNFDGVVPNGDLEDFKQFREETSSAYKVVQFGIERYQRLSTGWTVHMRFESQYADDNLIPAEQGRLGGISTVRGYEESEVSGDRFFLIRTDIRTPSLPVFLTRRLSKKYQDEVLQIIGFVDYGLARIDNAQQGDPDETDIAGTGFGLRYQLLDYFLGRVDFAWTLMDGSQTRAGDSHIHFSAQINF